MLRPLPAIAASLVLAACERGFLPLGGQFEVGRDPMVLFVGGDAVAGGDLYVLQADGGGGDPHHLQRGGRDAPLALTGRRAGGVPPGRHPHRLTAGDRLGAQSGERSGAASAAAVAGGAARSRSGGATEGRWWCARRVGSTAHPLHPRMARPGRWSGRRGPRPSRRWASCSAPRPSRASCPVRTRPTSAWWGTAARPRSSRRTRATRRAGETTRSPISPAEGWWCGPWDRAIPVSSSGAGFPARPRQLTVFPGATEPR